MVVNMLSFDRSKVFQHKCYCLESLKTKRVRKTTVHESRNLQESRRLQEAENHKIMKSPGNQEIHTKSTESGSPQESKKTAKSQESRTSRVWKTGRLQESRIRRITPNNVALFPPAKEREREKGKRDSSLKSMVKSRDDSSFSQLHPWLNP
jgi:hypothetical protein